MKKIVFGLIATLVVFSCENTDTSIQNSNSEIENKFNFKNENNLFSEKETLDRFNGLAAHVNCSGSCNDCSIIINLDTGIGQCGCNDCKLTVVFKHSDKIISNNSDNEKLQKSLFNLDFFKTSYISFKNYREKNYNIKSDRVENISFYSNGNVIAVMFDFFDSKGIKKSVMYSQQILNKNSIEGTKYEIVCDGACGCKEVFNFNNGTASCSCNDCKMTVTQIKLTHLAP